MRNFDIVLCGAISGALLCWAHGYFPFVALVACAPLLFGLYRATPRQAFYSGLVCGGIESLILVGTLHYTPTVFLALALGYGLQRALFAVLVVRLGGGQTGIMRFGLAPAVWALLEIGHSALPNSLPNLLGDTQHNSILLPLVALGGTHFLSFILVWCSCCLADLADRWAGFGYKNGLGSLVWCCVVGALLVGARGSRESVQQLTMHSAVVVQGGHPRWVNEFARDFPSWREVPLAGYEILAARAPKSDIMVWPEAPVWRRWGQDGELEARIKPIAASENILVAGFIREDEGGTAFNSAFVFEKGEHQVADKQRLVLQEELAYGQGESAAIFDSSIGQLGVVFCLESVVPSYARELVQAGAGVLIVLANGADLGKTPVARLHAQRSKIRAVEMGRWVIHAGHHGYSHFISPFGESSHFAKGYASSVVGESFSMRKNMTPYARWGDAGLLAGCFSVVGFAFVVRIRRRWVERR